MSTRPRDFYDVYILTKTRNYDRNVFEKALEETSRHRKSFEIISEVKKDFSVIEKSSDLQAQWEKYAKANPYAEHLSFEDVCLAVKDLLK